MGLSPVERVHEGLAEMVAHDLADYKITAYPFIPSTGDVYPVAFVELDGSDPIDTRTTTLKVRLALVVLFGAQIEEAAQRSLAALMAAIPQMMRADRKIRGTCSSSTFIRSESLNMVQLAGYQAWGHRWVIDVVPDD